MRKVYPAIGLLFVLLILFMSNAEAKPPSSLKKEPKTKLEAFQAQTGAVIIKGYSNIGRISALGSIEVTAMEFTDASTGRKQKGIVIEIKESNRFENSDRSFVDYDEIETLLKGIDYISKVTANATNLSEFEATYKTNGDFKLTTFSNSRTGKISAAVRSGYIRPATSFISLQQLSELKSLIVKAKQKLDSLK